MKKFATALCMGFHSLIEQTGSNIKDLQSCLAFCRTRLASYKARFISLEPLLVDIAVQKEIMKSLSGFAKLQ